MQLSLGSMDYARRPDSGRKRKQFCIPSAAAIVYKMAMPPDSSTFPFLPWLICVLLAAGCGILLFFLWRERERALKAELERDNLQRHRDEELALRDQEEQRRLREHDELARRLCAELTSNLNHASQEQLHFSQEQFRQFAEETLKARQIQARGDLLERQQAIDALLRPVGTALEQVRNLMTSLEKERRENMGNLTAQLRQLGENNARLLDQTGLLSSALKDNKVRGQWGEIQLKRIVELAGMCEHCDFDTQVSADGGGGTRLRPDMIVHLPGQQEIIVDAKAPMSAFLRLASETDETRRSAHIREHAQAVRARIRELASREYHKLFEGAPEFVILFLPNEEVMRTALDGDDTLFDYGVDNRVILATPSTLIPMLKTVAHSWRQHLLAQEARNIAEQGRKLHESGGILLGHAGKLGRQLQGSVEAYNKLLGSLETRLIPRARELERMGAALTAHEDAGLPPPIEAQPRLPVETDDALKESKLAG